MDGLFLGIMKYKTLKRAPILLSNNLIFCEIPSRKNYHKNNENIQNLSLCNFFNIGGFQLLFCTSKWNRVRIFWKCDHRGKEIFAINPSKNHYLLLFLNSEDYLIEINGMEPGYQPTDSLLKKTNRFLIFDGQLIPILHYTEYWHGFS